MKNNILPYFVGAVAALALAFGLGCQQKSADSVEEAVNGGKAASAKIAATQSKSSALFGVIKETPAIPAPAARAADVGVTLNGPAAPADVDWARKLAASDAEAAKAKTGAAKLAAENVTLKDRLAHAITPEEAQDLRDKGAKVQAELDAFAFQVKVAVAFGLLVLLATGAAAWFTERPMLFIYGAGASTTANVIPFIVKAVAESLALKIVIGTLGGAFVILIVYELVQFFRGKESAQQVVAVAEKAAQAVETTASATTAGVVAAVEESGLVKKAESAAISEAKKVEAEAVTLWQHLVAAVKKWWAKKA